MANPLHDQGRWTKLFNALTEYDIKQSKKAGYNPYALGHYAKALENVEADMIKGMTIRQAIINNFCGQLMNVCLKACGEPKATKEESR